jgi:hypothetical protein
MKILAFFLFLWVIFALWIRIRIQQLKLMRIRFRIRIRIRNPGGKYETVGRVGHLGSSQLLGGKAAAFLNWN